ncbi:MAG: hypothetical protein KF812_02235 [Fimbriimonadaceae bacterium]|nr:hypothetical protein [Fimbriimonadaceae bacterium]
MRATTFDLAAFSAGGENLLGTVKAVRYRVETETVDARPITTSARRAQPTKRHAIIETTQTSMLTAPLRVTHLNVSAATAGGEDWRAHIRRGWFRADFRHAEGSAVGDLWRWPVLVERGFRARFDLLIPTDGVLGLNLAHAAPNLSAVTLSLTINGVTVALPMVATRWEHRHNPGEPQMIRVDLLGQGPESGDYPASPSGTTSLLEKSLNAADDPVAITLMSRADGGAEYAGDFMFAGMQFSVADGDLVTTDFAWTSRGAVTVTETAA